MDFTRRKICVNSAIDRDLTSSSTTDMTVFLSQSIQVGRGKVGLGVKKMTIPNLAYTFHPTENTLWYVTSPDISGWQLKSIEINTNRVYIEPSHLITELNAKATANGDDISFSYDATTAKISLFNNEAYAIGVIPDYIY